MNSEISFDAAIGSRLIAEADPFEIFDEWSQAARQSEPNDANAMALATATPEGLPSVRMVLLKGYDRSGFVFYTNSNSRKGSDLARNRNVALLFHWKSLRRQIRIEGSVSAVERDIADDYFSSRSRDSQLGAVASDQSAPMVSRAMLLRRFEQAKEQFVGRPVQRPDHWLGFRVAPVAMEFWIDRPHRLHERRRFTRSGDKWQSTLLYP